LPATYMALSDVTMKLDLATQLSIVVNSCRVSGIQLSSTNSCPCNVELPSLSPTIVLHDPTTPHSKSLPKPRLAGTEADSNRRYG
jgi:hypothetical protein